VEVIVTALSSFRLHLIFCIVFIPCLLSAADIEYKTVQASGYGSTKTAAVRNALQEAIGQVAGRYLEAEDQLSSVFKTKVVDDQSTFSGSESLSSRVASATKGVVKEYSILSENKGKDESWECLVEATIARAIPSMQSNRKRIAVLPFQYRSQIDDEIFEIRGVKTLIRKALAEDLGEASPEDYLAELFTDNLESYLIQSRKFMVLDRRSAADISSERDFALSASVSIEEMLKSNQDLSADMIVVGSIDEVTYSERDHTMRSGRVVKIGEGTVILTFKILDVATRELKFSDTVMTSVSSGDISKVSGSLEFKKPGPAMLKIVADQIGSKILEAIYPIRVLRVNDQSVTLSGGGRTIKRGEIYEVFNLGEKLFDPNTKESLGREELYVGKILISRVKSKMSEGEVMESKGQIEEGGICRLAADQEVDKTRKRKKINTDDLF
jgi:hypothetical protein